MANDNTKLAVNRVNGLVTFDGILVATAMEVQTFTGGDVTIAESIKDRDPGAAYDETIPNLRTISDITAARVFRSDRDDPILDALLPRVGELYGKASKIIRDLDGNRVTQRPYGVLLTGLAGPEGDTNGNGKGMITFTLAPYSVG